MRSLREEAERFDRRAGRYDRWLSQRWFFRPVHRTMMQALDPVPGERFLEVGSGTGNLTLAAAAISGSAVGVDPSPGMVAVARAKDAPPGAVAFLVAAAETLPFPDASFDVSASAISMHHWVDVDAGLRELHRITRPGGRIVLADLAPRGAGKALAAILSLGSHQDHTAFDQLDLARRVREAGFSRVRIRRRGAHTRLVAFIAADRD